LKARQTANCRVNPAAPVANIAQILLEAAAAVPNHPSVWTPFSGFCHTALFKEAR